MTRTGNDASRREPPGVLAIGSFRRLWIALSLSSLGDWLSILTLTATASALTADSGFQVRSFAIGGVLVAAMLPAVLLSPVGGAIAGRADRRTTMLIADVLRFGLLLSVPLVGRLDWLLVATVLTACASLIWTPAKDAAIPTLVPKDRLEQAARVNRVTTYGSAPVAAVLFALVSLISGALAIAVPFFRDHPGDLALYVNAGIFLISALVVGTFREAAGQAQGRRIRVPSTFTQLLDGWRSAGGSTLVRGLMMGVLAAFAAGGAVIGVARLYVGALGGGDAAYGAVFATLFLGMAVGLFLGPRILRPFSRRRLFGLATVGAGLALLPIPLIHNLVLVALFAGVLGGFAGIAWATARTLIGLEVEDGVRARAWAFLHAVARLVLLLVVAAAAAGAGPVGVNGILVGPEWSYDLDGTNVAMLATALIAILLGLITYRYVDDRRGIPLRRDLAAALRGHTYVPETTKVRSGVFIAFEGGEGAGKSTQARLLAIWLRDHGYDVVSTQEPGATKIGMRLRAILLDKQHHGLSSRAEALLYAADRAEHVAAVINPALDRGAVVITDRYIDSSLAYQGAGRVLSVDEVARVNQWATDGLLPDLTIVLDVPAEVGLGRFATPADRIESEPREFHERVQRGFLQLAEAEPHRYVVIDGTLPQEEITKEIQRRVLTILPDPIPVAAEEVTTTMPAIRD